MLQTKQKINLREERDFGDKLNATFYFIKTNFRPLLRALLLYVTPVALAAGIFSGLFQARTFQRMTGEATYSTFGDNVFMNQVTSLNYILSMIFTLLSIFILSLTVYSFMVVYQDEEGEVQPAAVWEHIKANLVPVIYSGIAISVVTFLSIFFFGLGIYLGIVLSLFIIVMVREELGFIETVERCFYLIKGNWWATFGFLLIVGIIQGLIGVLAALPLGAVTMLRAFEVPGMDSDILLVVVNASASVLSIFLYCIYAVAIGFQYYNLVEQKDGIGLMEQVDLIGRSETNLTANEGEF
ncbi:hypothetical protein DXT99_15520 [Pontibacter diazotrophicus]|uniref:Glycerophosphoryl diester phosphodiesterase membrane domain-containing protein n=1 Tax=Pontibacter diazotrophicus TaxID=1400979 RepID=A0A3D8L9X7_9BACT|nr:hypothetical protein [Pontibacter diazotrophicus]RDV14200.1 hypothetical protein DXT99_15520 [Pontibacter diazotrophicus]